MAEGPVLEVRHLVKHFPVRGGFLRRRAEVVHAVDDLSFELSTSETLGIVGESGSGKTTLGRTVVMLSRPTSGSVSIAGKEISKMRGSTLRRARRDFNIVFQDPISSLDPRMRVKDIIAEPLVALDHPKDEIRKLVAQAASEVNMPEEQLSRLPHEFSGGQRQRIGIARALVSRPRLLVLDEPTSSLDVSVQAQILNLLLDIQEAQKLSYLFISHNVNVVRYMSDRIAVMYLGEFVEMGSAKNVMETPLHPYTMLLIASLPSHAEGGGRKPSPDLGEVPSSINPPAGCRFHTRCPYVQERCKSETPKLREVGTGHFVSCHFAPIEVP
jgi:oligopeptide/dipeptide ABC transporter ATP-binding protein